jgi:hypothetical protein
MRSRNTLPKKELLKASQEQKKPKLKLLGVSWKRNAISSFQLLLKNQFTKEMLTNYNAKLLLKVLMDLPHLLEKKSF